MAEAIARALVAAMDMPLPDEVAHEAKRALLNVLGVAVAGARHRAVDAVLACGEEGPVSVPGRRERCDPYTAAVATGLAAHIDDFDDTHLATVIHPSAAVLGALVGTGGLRRVAAGNAEDGGGPRRETLKTFALAVELQLRLGNALTHEHYAAGWHITGTCGAIGAAAASALALGLEARELGAALGVAGSTTLGHREAFGSDVKAFHSGKAAGNGLLVTLAAARGFCSADDALEGPHGYLNVLSDVVRPEAVLGGFGKQWVLLELSYKPYPCGIVAHPSIDAALRIARHLDGERPIKVRLRCNPLVMELMGIRNPKNGLEARFSAVHAIASALLLGRFGLDEVSDGAVADASLANLRGLIEVDSAPEVSRAAATLTVTLPGGSEATEHIDFARGSAERPLSDSELAEKTLALMRLRLDEKTAEDTIKAVRGLPEDASITTIVKRVSTTDGDRGGGNKGETVRAGCIGEVSAALADFAASLNFAEAPELARKRVRQVIANSFGVALAGVRRRPAAALLAAVPALGCRGEARVIGTRTLLRAPWAALVNGVAVHVDDFDDTHLAAGLHLGAPVVPAALAVAELTGASGADFLAGVLGGMEVAIRLATVLGPDHVRRGWHVTGTAGHVGAAVAAGRVASLDRAAMLSAIGIAATQAAGLRAAFGTDTKAWHAGKAAADGVEAALLASRGLVGPRGPVEAPRGFLALLEPTALENKSACVEGLASKWHVDEIALKPYACGVLAHAAIDAALAIRTAVDLYDDHGQFSVGVSATAPEIMNVTDPESGLAGKFCLAHCVAVALVDGAAGPTQFTDARVNDPEVSAVRSRVTITGDTALTKDAAWISFQSRDGRTTRHEIVHARGSAASPLTDEDVMKKIYDLVSPGQQKAANQLLTEILTAEVVSIKDVIESMSNISGT